MATKPPIEAAERLRRLIADRTDLTYSGVSGDLNAVLDWALPLLDRTPVDGDFLRSLGFTKHFGAMFSPRCGGACVSFHQDGKAFVEDGDYQAEVSLKTRGAVLTLLAALEGNQ
jgi:hypothetical protein